MRGHAKAFDTAKEKLGLTDSLYLGLRTVPVDSIVGSVNRWRILMPAALKTATPCTASADQKGGGTGQYPAAGFFV